MFCGRRKADKQSHRDLRGGGGGSGPLEDPKTFTGIWRPYRLPLEVGQGTYFCLYLHQGRHSPQITQAIVMVTSQHDAGPHRKVSYEWVRVAPFRVMPLVPTPVSWILPFRTLEETHYNSYQQLSIDPEWCVHAHCCVHIPPITSNAPCTCLHVSLHCDSCILCMIFSIGPQQISPRLTSFLLLTLQTFGYCTFLLTQNSLPASLKLPICSRSQATPGLSKELQQNSD